MALMRKGGVGPTGKRDLERKRGTSERLEAAMWGSFSRADSHASLGENKWGLRAGLSRSRVRRLVSPRPRSPEAEVVD